MRFEHPRGNFTYLDVMESSSLSAMMPIARFNLTHLRRGISAEGYFDLHPQWHRDEKTYTSPRIRTQKTRKIAMEHFVSRYRERGMNVDDRLLERIKRD